MDKERQMLKEEVQERLTDFEALPKVMKCRKDGVPGAFTEMLSLTAMGAALEFAKKNKLKDKSIVHVHAEGRFLIIYKASGNHQAIKLQQGANDKMISTIEVVKG